MANKAIVIKESTFVQGELAEVNERLDLEEGLARRLVLSGRARYVTQAEIDAAVAAATKAVKGDK